MQLFEEINNDLKQAMREKKALDLSVLRMLVSSLQNKKISLGKDAELSDEIVTEVVKSEIKKRKDSILSYRDGGRDDLAEAEEKEISIIEKYMPEQMSQEELEKVVKEVIDSMGEVGPGDFGKVMGAVMGRVKGKADGTMVSGAVKQLLS